MKDRRFNQSLERFGVPITIRTVKRLKQMGCLNERTGEIVIRESRSRVGAHITLLHELLHAVDIQMVSTGITRRRVDHPWIESAAMNLLALLVLSGFWRGINTHELSRFMARSKKAPGRKKANP